MVLGDQRAGADAGRGLGAGRWVLPALGRGRISQGDEDRLRDRVAAVHHRAGVAAGDCLLVGGDAVAVVAAHGVATSHSRDQSGRGAIPAGHFF